MSLVDLSGRIICRTTQVSIAGLFGATIRRNELALALVQAGECLVHNWIIISTSPDLVQTCKPSGCWIVIFVMTALDVGSQSKNSGGPLRVTPQSEGVAEPDSYLGSVCGLPV